MLSNWYCCGCFFKGLESQHYEKVWRCGLLATQIRIIGHLFDNVNLLLVRHPDAFCVVLQEAGINE